MNDIDRHDNNYNLIDTIVKNEFMTVLIWIALWGIFDTILNKFVALDNFIVRIIIYILILISALLAKNNILKSYQSDRYDQ